MSGYFRELLHRPVDKDLPLGLKIFMAAMLRGPARCLPK
ncbi:hypothetical protein P608_02660 [Comamonas thiooxydans]|uniref:Uncharacterized protein n=1 Tax=Comamonas thiooxydans TaxID=363952 RepID=A0A0E3C6I1_9BURK|nr:hypothetical protein P607_13825 [Comamonas thiooxydans]KGH20659.1 hypothetical protein P608_02660 [Comamonas thiooxydans]KGH24783.1 hypothetical protein P606_07115 [Comamonas thiooxydans]